ncbi:MAG: dihydroorotase [Candidatus Latescibacterota bacterium]
MTRFNGDLLIRGGRVVDPAAGVDGTQDLWIEGGRVAGIGHALPAPAGIPTLEAAGLLVLPGFIDGHVHLREPGFEHKETIATGTAAAAAGGICTVVCMPNTQPPPDTPERIHDLYRRIEATAQVRVYPIGCITRGRAGRELAPLVELAEAGAVGFSDDGDPIEDAALMTGAFEAARQAGRPLCPHEEVKALTAGGCMHEGEVSRRLGVRGMPARGEEEMVARDLELARRTSGPLHVAHLSTAVGLELVRRARVVGAPVTCEVMTHHLVLTDEAVADRGTNAKMSPPLRPAADAAALTRGLADGSVQAIATDHAPHADEEKALPLERAPFGIVGLETAVGLTFTYLVATGAVPLATAVAAWTWGPARIFGLPGGRLAVGDPGDVTVVDPGLAWTVDPKQFHSRSRNTPFAGYKLTGKAVATVVGGTLVHRDPDR